MCVHIQAQTCVLRRFLVEMITCMRAQMGADMCAGTISYRDDHLYACTDGRDMCAGTISYRDDHLYACTDGRRHVCWDDSLNVCRDDHLYLCTCITYIYARTSFISMHAQADVCAEKIPYRDDHLLGSYD